MLAGRQGGLTRGCPVYRADRAVHETANQGRPWERASAPEQSDSEPFGVVTSSGSRLIGCARGRAQVPRQGDGWGGGGADTW